MLRQALLGELQFEAENTRKLFKAIPDDVLKYKPNDFNWDLGQLVAHVAQIYNWWEATLYENEFAIDSYKYQPGDIYNMDNNIKKLNENIAKAIKSLDDYPEARFMENWSMISNGKVVIQPMPRIQVIRGFLMSHLYHHRGELIAYLRVNHKPVPGLYGPSYEETKAWGA